MMKKHLKIKFRNNHLFLFLCKSTIVKQKFRWPYNEFIKDMNIDKK